MLFMSILPPVPTRTTPPALRGGLLAGFSRTFGLRGSSSYLSSDTGFSSSIVAEISSPILSLYSLTACSMAVSTSL